MGVCMSSGAHGVNNVLPEDSAEKAPLRPDTPDRESLGGLIASHTGTRGGSKQRMTIGSRTKVGAAALPESVQTADSLPPPSRGGLASRGGAADAIGGTGGTELKPALEARLASLEGALTQAQQQLTNMAAENQALRSRLQELSMQQAQYSAQLRDLHLHTSTASATTTRVNSSTPPAEDYGYGKSGYDGGSGGGGGAGGPAAATVAAAAATANAVASRTSMLEGQMSDVQQKMATLECNVAQIRDTLEGQRAAQEFAKQLQRVQESGLLPSRNHTPHGSRAGVAAWLEPELGAELPAPAAFPKLKPARERRRMDGPGAGHSSGGGDHAGAGGVTAAGFASGPRPRPGGQGRRSGAAGGVGAVQSPRTGAGITPAGWKSGPSQYSRAKPPGAPGTAPPGGPGPAAPSPLSGGAGGGGGSGTGSAGRSAEVSPRVSILQQPQPPPPPLAPASEPPYGGVVHVQPRTAPDPYSPSIMHVAASRSPVDRIDSGHRLEGGRQSPTWCGAGSSDRADALARLADAEALSTGGGGGGGGGGSRKAGDRVDSLIRMERGGNGGDAGGGIPSPSWVDRSAGSKAGGGGDRPPPLTASDWRSPTGSVAPSFQVRVGSITAVSGAGGTNVSGTYVGMAGAAAGLGSSGAGASGPGGGGGGGGGTEWSEHGPERPSAPPERSAASRTRVEVRPASHQEWGRRPFGEDSGGGSPAGGPSPERSAAGAGGGERPYPGGSGVGSERSGGGVGSERSGGGAAAGSGGGGIAANGAVGASGAAHVLSIDDEDLRGFGERAAAGVLSAAARMASGDADWGSGLGLGGGGGGGGSRAGGGRGGPEGMGDVRDKLGDSDPDIEMSGRLLDDVASAGSVMKPEMMQMQRYDNVLPSDLLLAHHLRQGGGARMGVAGAPPKIFL